MDCVADADDDEYAGLSSTFARACREADRKHRPEQPSNKRALLTDDSLSLEQLSARLHALHFAGRAASSTVEALMYSLRQRGTAALRERDTLHRLAQLSDAQLREVAVRVQRFKPEIAPAWTADETAVLIAVRSKVHAEKP